MQGDGESLGMSVARFEDLEVELHRAAVEATRLEDFGDPAYLIGLRVLLRAFDTDPQLTEIGRQFAYGTVLGTLTARLHTQHGWSQHRELLQQRIERPLVITGIPRTGTTALHKLLSMDPQFQGLERWLTETPMVRPPRESWETLPAFRAAVANLEAFFTAMPDMRKAHDMVADEPDECLEVLRQSFVSNRFSSSAYLPSYDRWFFEQTEINSYRRYVDVLRLIGGAESGKRWLLKNPGHIAQIEALFEVLPDACVIQTHRDPVQAIPSLCSTLYMARRMFEADATRAEIIGARECRYWREALSRTDQARCSRAKQFFDVDHRDFVADPMQTVKDIYNYFSLELSAVAQERMQVWIAARPTSKHGEHRYRLEDFGITASQVRDEFADYRHRHQFI
jgi:Sulfotransferase family